MKVRLDVTLTQNEIKQALYGLLANVDLVVPWSFEDLDVHSLSPFSGHLVLTPGRGPASLVDAVAPEPPPLRDEEVLF